MPQTTAGKWSLGLNTVFVVVVVGSVFAVLVLRVLSFGDRWWDITVGILVPTTLIAFGAGLSAWCKHKDRSMAVRISLLISLSAILFALLHSAFIQD